MNGKSCAGAGVVDGVKPGGEPLGQGSEGYGCNQGDREEHAAFQPVHEDVLLSLSGRGRTSMTKQALYSTRRRILRRGAIQ